MLVPPRIGERRVAGLEGRDRVLVALFEAVVVALTQQARRAEPFLVGRYGSERRVKAVCVEAYVEVSWLTTLTPPSSAKPTPIAAVAQKDLVGGMASAADFANFSLLIIVL
jgi:hypothetical protein